MKHVESIRRIGIRWEDMLVLAVAAPAARLALGQPYPIFDITQMVYSVNTEDARIDKGRFRETYLISNESS